MAPSMAPRVGGVEAGGGVKARGGGGGEWGGARRGGQEDGAPRGHPLGAGGSYMYA